MNNVTVVGGGIIGLCSAYYLQKAGLSVTVVERGNITDGCSFGNMGYISPSHFVPLASPGIIAEGFKYMLNSRSPFYIKPRLNFGLLQWAYHFYKNSNAATVAKNAPELNNILHLSRKLINDIKNDIGSDFLMEEKGCLMMCKTQKSLSHEFHLADEGEKFGLVTERLNREEVQALEPNVETDVAGAVLFKDDAHFHPGKMMFALKNYLLEKKVHFELNTTVTGFEKSGNKVTAILTDQGKLECNQIVLATGSWLPGVAKMLGIKLLLQGGKGYSYTYPHVEKNILYPAILVDGRCAITPWQNILRIGGTMEISGLNDKVLVNRMEGVFNYVKSFYPGLKIDFPPKDKIWNGLRPVTPDGLAYIGKAKEYNNVVIAGGHAMLGLSQGSGTGLLVSQLVQEQATAINLKAFAVDRFK